jgi:hypothetical protein
MERQAVSSSNISSVGYDIDSETLEVEFVKTGKVYEYYNVPKFEFDRLLEASSIGIYFNANIRNSYSCSPV